MRKCTFTLSLAMISLSACTNTDNPQLAMCQAVAKQLTQNSISSWDSDSSTDNPGNVAVKVAFTNSSGQAGTLNCKYKKQQDGTVDTAPQSVVLNNQPVDRNTLISVGTKASKALLAGTYRNTVEKSNQLAGEASEKATELAGQAKDAAIKGAKTMQELQK